MIENTSPIAKINDVILDEDYTQYYIHDYDRIKGVFRIIRIGDYHSFTLTEECVKDMYLMIEGS